MDILGTKCGNNVFLIKESKIKIKEFGLSKLTNLLVKNQFWNIESFVYKNFLFHVSIFFN